MNNLDKQYIVDGITINKTDKGYRVFTIPTQHFDIVDLDELTNDRFDYEIKRFASDIDYNVVGVFSKFISFFKKNYEYNKIFTFLDLRWNPDKENNLYNKNSFKLVKQLKPDYTYYNSKVSRYKRFHKFGFGKSSLKNKYPEIYSDDKTEWEMMQELGYDRIWDCGKYKYEITN
jgi:hypothetical protein